MLGLVLAAAAIAAEPQVSPEVASFVSACMDGKITVEKGALEAVEAEQLPYVLRQYLSDWSGGRFYKVSGKSAGYLLLAKGSASTLTGLNEICAFAARGLHFPTAHKQVAFAIFGDTAGLDQGGPGGTPPYTILYNPEQHYVFTASLLSPHREAKSDYNFTILLLGHFDEATRPTTEAFLEKMREGSDRTSWRTIKPWLGQQPPGSAEAERSNNESHD